ncbi:septum site-determining protein MinC [Humitalea rosea]|uniref:Probable septum site-determining protein MinC n=1 Tax=Humitalea rosea TaxID=990373 RepID=A0A2W7I7X7_9PROT|nr:septum site-determining protein MinC [Humitalea rosea]PZW42268.1 septum site-determining protein MinC [Humitalea rosea]
MSAAAPPARIEPFRLRGANFNLLVLRLLDPRVEVVVPAIGDQFRRAPGMLRHAPVVIGLDDLAVRPDEVDFAALVAGLREHAILPIGTSGGSAEMRAAAQSAGLAPLRGAGHDTAPPIAVPVVAEPAPVAPPPESSITPARPTMFVDQPVRAGQRIWAQGADLVINGTVNPGAEVIADGSLHVYGALRGRAIAGGSDNMQARVFALQFDPELVSIAGYYAVRDGYGDAPMGRAVQVRLVGETMRFDRIG